MRQIRIPEQLRITSNYEEFFASIKTLITNCEFSRINFFYGSYSKDLIAEKLIKDLRSNSELKDKEFRIKEQEGNENSLLIAIGGGKILDQVKYLAYLAKTKFISIPTLISHDGICSPVAVIDGKSLGAIMPSALVVPLFIIKEANLNQIQSGIGDLISNLSAVEDWKLASKFNNEAIDDFAIMLSKQAAMSVISLLESENDKHFLKEDYFLRSLIEALTISGIAMSIAGNSRPCSGAEHMISHAIDEIYGHSMKASHGIQVLVATLLLEKIRDYDLIDSVFAEAKEINFELSDLHRVIQKKNSKLYQLLKRFDFPTEFEDIGINEKELMQILLKAPKTRANRYTVLNLFLMQEAF